MKDRIKLEVCAGSVQSAIEGQKGGAVRVELCANLAQGGITPSISEIEIARANLDIDLNVLIRPREGDFLYSELEFEIMKQNIHHCGKMGCDGVVFGILDSQGAVDIDRNKELIDIAKEYGMSATFHRAFDRCADLFHALDTLIYLGFDRILTSGGEKTTFDGKSVLKKLIEQAGNNIIVMPGGGITENNIRELVDFTNLKEFHGSFGRLNDSKMEYISPNFDEKEDCSFYQTDADTVRKALIRANDF